MRHDLVSEGSQRVVCRTRPRCGHPHLVLLFLLLTVVVSAGLCVAAILAPAPAMAVPVAVLTCVGAPIFAAWDAPAAVASLRAERSDGKALAAFRQCLNELPEIDHPRGL